MLEDFLTETVTDLQKIEGKQRKEEVDEEAVEVADNILGLIKTYQDEAQHVDIRWGNVSVQ